MGRSRTICRLATRVAGDTGQDTAGTEPPAPLPGYQVLEVTVTPGSPAAGVMLGTIRWPAGSIPVCVLHRRTLQDPDPRLTLAPADGISLLSKAISNE
jgi:hypothetical protein